VRVEIIWRYHVRDEIFKIAKIFILKIIANVRFCPLMVIADGGACAWLFIETRATRAYQAHAPKTKRNAPKKNFALARQVGLRSSSVLLCSKPLLVIADKRLFINSQRVNFGVLFI